MKFIKSIWSCDVIGWCYGTYGVMKHIGWCILYVVPTESQSSVEAVHGMQCSCAPGSFIIAVTLWPQMYCHYQHVWIKQWYAWLPWGSERPIFKYTNRIPNPICRRWFNLWCTKTSLKGTKFAPMHTMMTSSNGNIFRVTGPLCGEFTGPGEFPIQRPVTRSFDVFFDLRLNKRLSKQPWGWWFQTPSRSLLLS